MESERIILNVGGIKYQTYRSTLTLYPDTLLATMFQDRNKSLIHPINNKGNEYFIDRNGYAFRYVLEYYRTGQIFWPDENVNNNTSLNYCHCNHYYNSNKQQQPLTVLVSRKELMIELDYFQIPFTIPKEEKPRLATTDEMAEKLDIFVKALNLVIYFMSENYKTHLSLKFYAFHGSLEKYQFPTSLQVEPFIPTVLNIMKPFDDSGYPILNIFGSEIQRKDFAKIFSS
ncbi:9799_t:CDS:2 [Diversispora eburnea]|uniref:9799_t:CDS:1 n=1 Tax=Diversispora eburnea TaxID=1213867 RepID=A0A9N8YUH0_9GLOM|nr:9799_t:CDS:2 [Diversispora eburnea]